jgi:TRAP-type C4-dicarboxylate transport system permease small subunit
MILARVNRALDRLARGMSRAAGWMFILCAVFITLEVIARKFFGISSQSTTELSGYLLAFGMAWGLAGALEARTHVRVDVFIQRVPPRLRCYLHAVAILLLAVFAGFIAWGGWQLAAESWDFRATDISALKTPLIIPQGIWTFGLVVFFVMVLARLAEVIARLPSGDVDAIERLTGPRSFTEEAAEALEAIGAGEAQTAR